MSRRKGRVRVADSKLRKLVDEVTLENLEGYFEYQQKKKSYGDYFDIKVLYKDPSGKFISKEEGRKRLREGKPVIKQTIYVAKVDIPELNIVQGQPIKKDIEDEVLKHVAEEIRRYNTILAVAYYQDLPFEEAEQLVHEIITMYENGEITAEEVHEILSP